MNLIHFHKSRVCYPNRHMYDSKKERHMVSRESQQVGASPTPTAAVSSRRRSLSEQLVQNTVESIGLWLLHKRTMVLFDLGEISHKIRFMCWNPLCSLKKLPEYEEDGKREHPVP